MLPRTYDLEKLLEQQNFPFGALWSCTLNKSWPMPLIASYKGNGHKYHHQQFRAAQKNFVAPATRELEQTRITSRREEGFCNVRRKQYTSMILLSAVAQLQWNEDFGWQEEYQLICTAQRWSGCTGFVLAVVQLPAVDMPSNFNPCFATAWHNFGQFYQDRAANPVWHSWCRCGNCCIWILKMHYIPLCFPSLHCLLTSYECKQETTSSPSSSRPPHSEGLDFRRFDASK